MNDKWKHIQRFTPVYDDNDDGGNFEKCYARFFFIRMSNMDPSSELGLAGRQSCMAKMLDMIMTCKFFNQIFSSLPYS